MRTRLRSFTPAACALGLLAGCYHVTLEPPAPIPAAEQLLHARVDIPPDTAEAEYTVHSAMAGGANKWTIEVGRAIVDYANAYLPSAFPPGNDASVRIDLSHFDVHDFEAHVDLRFAVVTPNGTLFQRTYSAAGKGYAARVVWGGAFGMKSSMRKSTDEALRICFEDFLRDARPLAPGWATAVRAPGPTPPP
jgi:hypothetical protein